MQMGLGVYEFRSMGLKMSGFVSSVSYGDCWSHWLHCRNAETTSDCCITDGTNLTIVSESTVPATGRQRRAEKSSCGGSPRIRLVLHDLYVRTITVPLPMCMEIRSLWTSAFSKEVFRLVCAVLFDESRVHHLV